MAQATYWPLLKERIDAELAAAQAPQGTVFHAGTYASGLHPFDGPPTAESGSHPAFPLVESIERTLRTPSHPHPLSTWRRVLVVVLGVLLGTVVVVTVDPIGQAMFRGLAALHAAAPFLLFGLFAVVAVTTGYLLQHPSQPPKLQKRPRARGPLDRAHSQPLLGPNIEHLQFISAWLRTDPGLDDVVDDVIGSHVAAAERRQVTFAIVLALVSSIVSLVLGALAATVLSMLHLLRP
jgi:hypothetical protein